MNTVKKGLFLVVLTAIVVGGVFAQSQEKYYLEIYDISLPTYNTITGRTNDQTIMREDDYFFVRTASGTALRSKDRGLSIEEVRQKVLSIYPGNTTWTNAINNTAIPRAQQQWGYTFQYYVGNTRVYVWLRRTE